ncbi:MAG: NYN domain-containing protein [Thermoleophilaceae bacterium]
MRWLIDGMNLIGSRPTGWWRDRPGAMRDLVEELERFAAASGEPVSVVFDGRPFELESGTVEVVFASRLGRDAADDDIASLAREGVRVVTSDRDLAGRVRAAGGEVEGVRAFRDRLDKTFSRGDS